LHANISKITEFITHNFKLQAQLIFFFFLRVHLKSFNNLHKNISFKHFLKILLLKKLLLNYDIFLIKYRHFHGLQIHAQIIQHWNDLKEKKKNYK